MSLEILVPTAAATCMFMLAFFMLGVSGRRAALVARIERAPADAPRPARRTLANLIEASDRTKQFLGLDEENRRLERLRLLQAGYFDPDAVTYWALIRIGILVALPVAVLTLAYLLVPLFLRTHFFHLLGASLVAAFLLPRLYLRQRRKRLELLYRTGFPEFADLLAVCVDGGMSLNAAIDRLAVEMRDWREELGINLSLLGAEIRAGRSTIEAIENFVQRLGIEEGIAFAMLLRQSTELGTDVTQALTVFSEELRDKRLSRAEEKAASLPAKLTLPLAGFLLPICLGVLLFPTAIKLLDSLSLMN